MNEPTPTAPPDPEDGAERRLPALPLALRLLLLVVGWLLLLVGIAGLALPGLQGCLTLALAAAVLSLASEMVYRGLRRVLRRWPGAWERVEGFRGWLHRKLSRRRDD